MRIIPGKFDLNLINSSEEKNKFIILAEVVDSSMGFENPVFVENPNELLIWFGNKFSEYEYLKELLYIDDVVLYLTHPQRIGIDPDNEIDDLYYFILDTSPENINTFEALRLGREEEEDLTFLSESIKLPSNGEGKYFKVILEDGYYYDSLYGIRYSYYTQDDVTGEYISAMNDPALLVPLDRLNRDYLQVSSEGLYSYFNSVSEESSIGGSVENIELEEFNKLQENIKSGIVSNNLHISGRDVIDLEEEDIKKSIKIKQITNGEEEYVDRYLTYFFTYPCTISGRTVWHYRFLVPGSFSDDEADIYLPINESGSNYLFISKANSDQPSTVRDLSLGSIQKIYLENLKNYYITYNFSTFIRIPYSYSMPEGFKYFSYFQTNQKDVYEKYVKGKELYRFESKTIGTCGENIKVSIRKKDTYEEEGEQFTVSISRYGYSEVFEGSFVGSPGVERLDYTISRDSKLVRFRIVGQPESGWIEGDWELLGSTEIEESDRDYQYSLENLTKKEETYPDFLLIPDKNQYTDKFILDTCERLNCQALVNNSGSNFETNLYTKDLDNRLIYFYESLLVGIHERPSYSVFLDGILTLDSYLPTDADVFYPIRYNSLENEIRDSLGLSNEDSINVETLAEKYRFNYLYQNNYQYYYPKYRAGENYNTTPLVRFVVSKITRELEKIKWKIIGEKVHKVTGDLIYRTLRNVQNRFSIIRSISLDSFEIDEYKEKLEASITTRLSDLVTSDVSFNILLNYSKTN